MTEPIFHIVGRDEWQAASELGQYQPDSLAAEGFVHFSYAHQVERTANLLYHARQDLIVVEFDADGLPSPVVEEDLYDAGELFPHVYAAIPVSAAVAEHRLDRDGHGDLRFVRSASGS